MENQNKQSNCKKNTAIGLEVGNFLSFAASVASYLYFKYHPTTSDSTLSEIENCALTSLIANTVGYVSHIGSMCIPSSAGIDTNDCDCDCNTPSTNVYCFGDPCNSIGGNDDDAAGVCLLFCACLICMACSALWCSFPKAMCDFTTVLGTACSAFTSVWALIKSNNISMSKNDKQVLLISSILSISSSLVMLVNHVMRRSCFKHICKNKNSNVNRTPLLKSAENEQNDNIIPPYSDEQNTTSIPCNQYYSCDDNSMSNPYSSVL